MSDIWQKAHPLLYRSQNITNDNPLLHLLIAPFRLFLREIKNAESYIDTAKQYSLKSNRYLAPSSTNNVHRILKKPITPKQG